MGYIATADGRRPPVLGGSFQPVVVGHKETHMSFVWMALVGLVVGFIARAVLPGAQSLGLILTAALGIAGSFIAGFAGQALGLYQAGQSAGFIGSIVGAIVLLFIVGKVKGSST
jgi:uncharacterized membrane protein YeaQ/YmgE (transglycosylase-associated protein family)